ncbi:exodeoxyribonuclease III [uncultured Friedmanniella sp.]|uniref:exodeoxyribonuclease III n=1 Tax=uncultured Friedmanniella sp. TaxID=335381 RepID=UPI0035CB2961
MRIATWNVNSIGARLPRLLDWLATRAPDVAALQETKCSDATFPWAEIEAAGYEAMHVGDGRWNGVAILSKVGLTPVATGLPGMSEPRYAAADCAGLRVRSVYVPNGRAVDDPQYPYKLEWFAALRDSLDALPATAPQVVMGDFNVARTDADVWDPALFSGSTHVTPAERSAMEELVGWGLTDVVARPGKNDRPYTYWDYRAGRFHQDQGMRIDYVLASSSVLVEDAWVDRDARKGKLPSDHAPVLVDCTLPD